MIRIRYLTPGSLAGLIVKTAEEQTALRLDCRRTWEVPVRKVTNGRKKAQKKGRA